VVACPRDFGRNYRFYAYQDRCERQDGMARKTATKKVGKKKPETMPTGPHTPISNVASEAGSAAGALVSPPEFGSADGVLKPRDDVEALWPEVTPESAAVPEARLPKMRDIGAASFRDPEVVLETVHGVDHRIQVEDTDKYPYRINASLLITARDGSQWIGTAWFISNRTLITAGHCVYIKNSGVPNRDGWVKTIQVMPGRNGTNLPYGTVTSSRFWTVKGWSDSGDENYDYAAIIIPTDLGSTVGIIGFGSYRDAELIGGSANVTGYPGDKPSGTMWYDSKGIASVTATKVYYDIDTAGGQSGAALYVIKNRQRIAVAVHAYGGPVTNSGTRISAPVFQNLTNWKE
jgi:V8-like Glu-specific endopeptidase